MVKSHPKIDDISISEEKQKLLKSALQHYDSIDNQTSDAIKRIVGGVCIICHGIPTKKLTYQMDGAIKIERYCDKCFAERDKELN